MRSPARDKALGLSLIELMIALLIGVILLLGIVQIFGASRTAYQLSEGLARTQENGRFAMDYLQRDVRMVGHFGCVNDQARLQTTGVLSSHLVASATQLNFPVSLQGYEANGTGPGQAVNLAAPAAGWSPALPEYLSGLNPLAGSDLIVVRYLSGDGVPVTTIDVSGIKVDSAKWGVLTQGGVAKPTLFGVADCNYVDIFQGNASGGTVTTTVSGLNATAVDIAGRYTANPAGPSMLYRADAIAYYIAKGAGGGPSLWRVRFGGGAVISVPEELVEGIENMQLLYAQDQSDDVNALSGNMASQNTAAKLLDATASAAAETNWRRVGMVQVGLLVRSPDSAAATAALAGARVLGTVMTPPADGRYRTTYETTIALRNRLYGN